MARLAVRLTPKAAADGIDGWAEDAQGRPFLKVRVRAAPVEGRANAALLVFLSKVLDVPKSRLSLLAGDSARLKQIEVQDMDSQVLREKLDARQDG